MDALNTSDILSTVVETIVDGLIVMDADSRIQMFNPAATEIFGYEREEVIGERIEILMPEPFRSEHHLFVHRYETTGNKRIIGIGREVRAQHKSGHVFPIHLSVGAFHSDTMHGYVGIIRDLTEEVERRKRLDEIQQSQFKLSRLDAMNQIGAAMAHELNQPLAALSNYMEAGRALVGQGQAKTETLQQVMDRAAEQARRAASVLARMRALVETGGRELALADPVRLCEDAIELVQPLIGENDVTIDFDAGDSPAPLLCDPVQVQQALLNLLRNAVEAVLTVDAPRRITLSCVRRDRDTLFSVADTGPGIPDTIRRHLFHPQKSTKSGGMGIGLAICRTVAEAHGGTIEALTNTPRGTIMHLAIPDPAQTSDKSGQDA